MYVALGKKIAEHKSPEAESPAACGPTGFNDMKADCMHWVNWDMKL